jgi:hypothetical protein
MKRKLTTAVVLGVLGSVSPSQAEDDGFEVLEQKRGIVVSARDEPGRSLPTFRAQGTLVGPVLHVLAVLLDDARSTEWAEGADEVRVLRILDERTRIVHSRSHQPWPVQDRDLVMKRVVTVLEPGRAFSIRLTCVEGELLPMEGVLRIRDCETRITVRAVDATHTHVDYQVRADAGGSAPTWLVARATRKVPFDTLVALERQVKRTQGAYERELRHWSNAPAG